MWDILTYQPVPSNFTLSFQKLQTFGILTISMLPFQKRNWYQWTKLNLHRQAHLTHLIYNLFIKVHITLESILIHFLHRSRINSWHVTNSFYTLYAYHAKRSSPTSFYNQPSYPRNNMNTPLFISKNNYVSMPWQISLV